jgi:hypothetical protein
MLKELHQYRRQWEAQKITDYRYTLQISCFCVPEIVQPLEIQVRNGVTTSLTKIASGAPVDTEYFDFDQIATMPKLFALIESAIANKAASISVTYDSVFGFPAHISIDHIKYAIDDEISYTVTDFTPLQ